jgi:uncharacterized protein (DUF3820 family)
MTDLAYDYLVICNDLAARLGQNRVATIDLQNGQWKAGSAVDLPEKYGADVALDYSAFGEGQAGALLALSQILEAACESSGA